MKSNLIEKRFGRWFSEENLISLCRSCYTRTNSNRQYWQEYLQKKIGVLV